MKHTLLIQNSVSLGPLNHPIARVSYTIPDRMNKCCSCFSRNISETNCRWCQQIERDCDDCRWLCLPKIFEDGSSSIAYMLKSQTKSGRAIRFRFWDILRSYFRTHLTPKEQATRKADGITDISVACIARSRSSTDGRGSWCNHPYLRQKQQKLHLKEKLQFTHFHAIRILSFSGNYPLNISA